MLVRSLLITSVAIAIGFVAGASDYRVELHLRNQLEQDEFFQGRIVDLPNDGGRYLTFYWHEPMSRHGWENGPFGCSEWLLKDRTLHYWIRREKFQGERRGSVQLGGFAKNTLKLPEGHGVKQGVDLGSIMYKLAEQISPYQGKKQGVLADSLWMSEALEAFWAGLEFEAVIEPELVEVRPDEPSASDQAVGTVEHFPPFGRQIKVSHGPDGSSTLVVRRHLIRAPVLELKKTSFAVEESEELAAIGPEDLGKLSGAPVIYRDYWRLQGELEKLKRSSGAPAAYLKLVEAAESTLACDLPQSLQVAVAQIRMRAAGRSGDLANSTNAVKQFLAAVKGTSYERWSVYEAGQAIKFLLENDVSVVALDVLICDTANYVVTNNFTGNEQRSLMLVGDLIASQWPLYAEAILDALESSGFDSEELGTLRARLHSPQGALIELYGEP